MSGTVPDALPEGYAVGGYRIARVIGAGGFGITYEALNPVTERRMAIKEFFPAGLARRDTASQVIYTQAESSIITWALEKFQATTTLLARMEHPNILRVHDYMPMNGTGYMIMEYLEGQTFEGWLQALEPRRPDSALLKSVLDPVLDALAYVHGTGLIHRDIAPDNIVITRTGRPVLIDFGAISKDVSKATKVAGTIGIAKRNYTAPEQARQDARPDATADIYSVGAVLYRAVAGLPPEDGTHRMSEVALGDADPYRPLTGRGDVEDRLARVTDECLALRKVGRPQTIEALRERLGWTAGANPHPQPVGTSADAPGPQPALPYQGVNQPPPQPTYAAAPSSAPYPPPQAAPAQAPPPPPQNFESQTPQWQPPPEPPSRRGLLIGGIAAATFVSVGAAGFVGWQLIGPSSSRKGDTLPVEPNPPDPSPVTPPKPVAKPPADPKRGGPSGVDRIVDYDNDFGTRAGFSPSGRFAAAGGNSKTVKLWDLSDGRLVRSFPPLASDIAWVGMGGERFVAAAGDSSKSVTVWDAQSGLVQSTIMVEAGEIQRFAFSPDGRTLLIAATHAAGLFDAETGKARPRFNDSSLVYGIAFLPDGQHVLCGDLDGDVTLYARDGSTGPSELSLGGEADVNAIAVMPDGRQALIGCDDPAIGLSLYQIEGWKLVRRFVGHNAKVQRAVLSPDGRLAASTGWDNKIRLWSTSTGSELGNLDKSDFYSVYGNLAFPDSKTVLIAGSNGLYRWSIETL